MLAGFLAELAVIDLRQPGIAARLADAGFEAGRAALAGDPHAPRPRAALFTSTPPPASARHPDLVLARAVAARALTHQEAVLIGATRLEPLRLADIARARGHSLAQTRAARVRAERKLSAYLRDPDRTPTSDLGRDRHDPGSDRRDRVRPCPQPALPERSPPAARATPPTAPRRGPPTTADAARRRPPRRHTGSCRADTTAGSPGSTPAGAAAMTASWTLRDAHELAARAASSPCSPAEPHRLVRPARRPRLAAPRRAAPSSRSREAARCRCWRW